MISYLGILAGLREIANRIKSDASAPHPGTLREYNRLRRKLLLSGYPGPGWSRNFLPLRLKPKLTSH